MDKKTKAKRGDSNLMIHLGPEELIIHNRYQVLSIVNDILIGIWFLVGSVMFLSSSWTKTGTYLFIAGSVEMLIRPAISFAHRVHLRKYTTIKVATSTDDTSNP